MQMMDEIPKQERVAAAWYLVCATRGGGVTITSIFTALRFGGPCQGSQRVRRFGC